MVLVDGPDLTARVMQATDGADIKFAFDFVGGETFERLVETLGYGAQITAYGILFGEQPEVNMRDLIFKAVQMKGFWLVKWFETATPKQQQAVLEQLVPLISSGKIKTKVDSRFPIEEITEAVTRAKASGRDGKTLLVPAHA